MAKTFFSCLLVAESDMDLDLLAESESDSESIHSNQDNVSVQRSAVTMATAGSDAGKRRLKEQGGRTPILLCKLITKTCLFKYIENFTTKTGKFSDKKF